MTTNPQPNLSGFWLAAFIRAALILVPAVGVFMLLVRPVSSPLHAYLSLAVGALAGLVLWLVVSTLRRYRYRLTHPVSPVEQAANTVSLRR